MTKRKSNVTLAKEIKEGRSNIRALNNQINSLKSQKAKESAKVDSLVDSLTTKLVPGAKSKTTRPRPQIKKESNTKYVA